MVNQVIYHRTPELVPYATALGCMERWVEDRLNGTGPERIWLLEHPPLYTTGTSAAIAEEILASANLPIFSTGRGGKTTYHGPGQRVIYVVLDLRERGKDLKRLMAQLQDWIVSTLEALGLPSFTREGRVGVWVYDAQNREAKIAAIGIRVKKWIAYHGIALNVFPDLDNFRHIIPCGISDYTVTSLKALGHDISMEDVDAVLLKTFSGVFLSPVVRNAVKEMLDQAS